MSQNQLPEPPMKKALSDDMLDGIVITLVILAIATGISYWLMSMPSA